MRMCVDLPKPRGAAGRAPGLAQPLAAQVLYWSCVASGTQQSLQGTQHIFMQGIMPFTVHACHRIGSTHFLLGGGTAKVM